MYSMKKSIPNHNINKAMRNINLNPNGCFQFEHEIFGLKLVIEVIFYPAEPENRILDEYCEIQSVRHGETVFETDGLHVKRSLSYYDSVDSILEEAAFEERNKLREDDSDG